MQLWLRINFWIYFIEPVEEDEGFDMAKTVIIAVCSAGAYLALVIGLTAYCSYRLLMQRKTRKQLRKFLFWLFFYSISRYHMFVLATM